MSSREADYFHIVEDWLDAANQDSPIALALRRGNYTTSRRLDGLIRTPGNIDQLRYILPGETDEHELNEEQKEELRAIKPYRNFLQNQHGLEKVDITTKSRDDFLDYIGLVYDPTDPTQYDPDWALRSEQSRAHPSSTASPTTSGTPSSPSSRELQQWDKGIKRDASAFPVLKRAYEWDDFWHKFTAIAMAQQVDKVLDPTYTPSPGTTEEALLQRMNLFVYSVLTNSIQTAKGEAIVKKYESTKNAQKVCHLLVEHHMDSVVADAQADVLFTKITATTIPPFNQDKTYEAYITIFRSNVRQYNKLADTPMDEATELTHLRNYVSTIRDLAVIKTQAKLLARLDKSKSLDPSVEIELYEAQAQELDSETKKNMFSGPARRAAARQAHYTEEYADYPEDTNQYANEDDEEYYEAYQVDEYHYHADFLPEPNQNSRPPRHCDVRRDATRTMLDLNTWRSLSSQGQDTWDRLSDKDKRIIIRSRQPRPRRNGTRESNVTRSDDNGDPPPSVLRNQQQPRSANRHETSQQDEDQLQLQVNQAETCDSLIDIVCHQPPIEANQVSQLPPYDLRRLLSQPNKNGELKNGEPMNGELQIKKTATSSAKKPAIMDRFKNRIGSNHRKKSSVQFM